MRISPLDLRNHEFSRQLAGYDRDEVDSFLSMVADDYEAVLRRHEAQTEELRRLQQRVRELTANEQVLQETLTTAQKLSEDLKRTAVREAEVTIGEAEIKGEKILEAAHKRVAKLADDIREMRQLKTRLAASVRAAIETHLGLLESLAADPTDDPLLDGKVAYLTPSSKRAAGEGPP